MNESSLKPLPPVPESRDCQSPPGNRPLEGSEARKQSSLQQIEPGESVYTKSTSRHRCLNCLDPRKVLLKLREIWRRASGWRAGSLICAMAAGIFCLVNIAIMIWAVSQHESRSGSIDVYVGSCSKVAKAWLWIQLWVNATSTLLLSASNYTMQIISSPTRKEVDSAHRNRKWLDIGVPSLRNVRAMHRGRIAMWIILAMCSLPFHFLYNSVFFTSLTTNEYEYFVVSEDFFTETLSVEYSLYSENIDLFTLTNLRASAIKQDYGGLVAYSPEACMMQYSKPLVSEFGNLLLQTTPGSGNDSVGNVFAFGQGGNPMEKTPWSWICQDDVVDCTLQEALNTYDYGNSNTSRGTWVIGGSYSVERCVVEPIKEQCRLSFSLTIMSVVILSTAMKASMMFLAHSALVEPTLVTLGDAIASFLNQPDPTTIGLCISNKIDMETWSLIGKTSSETGRTQFKRWKTKPEFWFRAASVKRWIVCTASCVYFLILGSVLFRNGQFSLHTFDIASLYGLGFGAFNYNSVVHGKSAPTSLIGSVLLANLPQAILSFLYLNYNGLLTCMLAAREWSHFSCKRQPLRVTSPTGKQKSTWFLEVPYSHSVPLLIISGVLHWLVSQSLFFVRLDVFTPTGTIDPSLSLTTTGYSCISVFFAVITGEVAISIAVLVGFRRYPAGIPLVGSCSAAISAACHRPGDDENAAESLLKWGAIHMDSPSRFGHCCLTSFEVSQPVKGMLYAGYNEWPNKSS